MPSKRKLSQTHPRLFDAEFVAITKYSKSTLETKSFKPEDAAGQKLRSWKQKHSHKSMQPTGVGTSSNNYALWKCWKHPDTHLYLAQVSQRTRQNNPSKCPLCAARLKEKVLHFSNLLCSWDWLEWTKIPRIHSTPWAALGLARRSTSLHYFGNLWRAWFPK